MLQVADTTVAVAAQEPTNRSCVVTVIDGEAPCAPPGSAAWIVRSTDAAFPVLGGEYPVVGSRLKPVGFLEFVVCVPEWVGVVSSQGRCCQVLPVLARIFGVPLGNAGAAGAVEAIVKSPIARKVGWRLGVLAPPAALHAIWRIFLLWPHLVTGLPGRVAWLAGRAVAASVARAGEVLGKRLGLAAVAAYLVHDFSPVCGVETVA